MTEHETSTELDLITDPVESAKAAGLRYVNDSKPGIRRERDGDTFRFFDAKGKEITDPKVLERIKSLGIPPAYTDVWISPWANGHIQATGRDAKGRKQYRYHPRWREVRDETKYGRMMAFGQALPLIREQTEKHLSLPGMPREKVLATVVRLLETTLIRVGNDEYAKTNKSYGLTTMRDKHVDISGSTVRFEFRGKSGKNHTISIKDRRLANIVKRSRDLPGYELFQYLDEDGQRRDVTSDDVNAYLREITGQEFTAKDFRTWAGTVLAALALQAAEPYEKESQAKKNIVAAIQSVSERLGNTPSICRKCYVHPAILDAYLEGTIIDALEQRIEQEIADAPHGLKPEERAVMNLLQARLAAEREHDLARAA
ncbi:MAG: DNA topoisomerase I [Chloroflexi bacterium]|nr:MAG: DNA topoisomerase I [Chloroflexota bacterium]